VQTNTASLLVGTSSWREQFIEALKVEGGDEEEGGEEGAEGGEPSEPKSPSAFDYFMHFISLFWKLLFAFVPPTG
jgi:solute carrier family 8 (sodium/calcium exchanger)